MKEPYESPALQTLDIGMMDFMSKSEEWTHPVK